MLGSGASSERVRAAVSGGAGYDEQLWRQMAAQGWLALDLPEAQGGLGLGFVEVAVLCEAVGRHVAPAPFMSTTLALHALASAGGAGAPWVERLASGDAIGCVAWGSELVVDAPIADVAVVASPAALRLLEFGEARPAAQPAMDLTRTVAWLEGDGGVVIADGEAVADLLDRGATAYAAEMLGASERMLEVSVDYAKVREQFGRPIGAFQAIKHRLADMLVDVEGMRSAVYYAAWAVATGADDRSLAASTAKSWASDASRRVMDQALQVHGGIGFTWEHDLHLYLKRVHLSGRQFGDGVYHRDRIARLLRARIATSSDIW